MSMIGGINPQIEIMRAAQERDKRNETLNIVSLCTQIVTHRDQVGQTAKGDAVCQHADRVLLQFFNEMHEEKT